MRNFTSPLLALPAVLALLSSACETGVPGELDDYGDTQEEAVQDQDQELEQDQEQEQGITEVSPELFDLLLEWAADSEAAAEDQGELPSLAEYVSLRSTEEALELDQVLSPLDGQGFRSGCSCELLATVDANPINKLTESDSSGDHNWSGEAHGAAHRGELYRSSPHSLTSFEKQRQHQTRFMVHMLCRNGQGQWCAASCSGKGYIAADYGVRLYGWADTGGIWNKAAHASAADGAKLTYAAPYSAAQVLFDKVGGVSHWGNKTAFNVDEVITFVTSALQIYTQIQTTSSVPDASLISKLIRSLSKLVSRSGNNGSTEQEMFASYSSFSSGFFNVSYSSSAAQVHTVTLTSQAKVKNRGWGGTNRDRSRYASSYTLATAVTNMTCANGVVPPVSGGVWRYATTPGAPYTASSLSAMTQNFFNILGLNMNQQLNGGETCVPVSCQPSACGYQSNGCGGTLYCGQCTYCGDGMCNGSETSFSCSADCGGGGGGPVPIEQMK